MTSTFSTWRFKALDTLFFRDSRPHSSAGAVVLASLFPPAARTVAGAVRFLIASSLGTVDWQKFGHPSTESYRLGEVDLLALIGRGDHYGQLRVSGPWLSVATSTGWRRLYPAPRSLRVDTEGSLVGHVEIGPPLPCDLGRMPLPRMPRASRPAQDLWLDAEAYRSASCGLLPSGGGVYRAPDLFVEEPRLGIARTLERHTATAGLLYQTRHIRPVSPDHLAVELAVATRGDQARRIDKLARLGGEGRLAEVDIVENDAGIPPAPEPSKDTLGLTLQLLTPAPLDHWTLPGFQPAIENETTVWRGKLHGIDLTMRSAVIGKSMRRGGWDLAAGGPRPVRSLLPAGSCWYVTVGHGDSVRGQDLAPAVRSLHGAFLLDNALGHGQLAVGLFDSSTFPSHQISLEDSV